MNVEITRTIKYCFNDEEYRKMKEEFEAFIYGLDNLNKDQLKDVEKNLNWWFEKYFKLLNQNL